MTGGGLLGDDRRLGARRHRHQHIFLALDQRGGVIAGHFETVAVRYCVGGAGFDAISAEDAAVVIDVVNLGVALATGDADLIGVFGGFDIDAVGGTSGSAEEAGDALFHAVFVALQDVGAAIALFEFRRLLEIEFGHGRRHHLLQGDAHSFDDGGRRTQNVNVVVAHSVCPLFYRDSGPEPN